MRPRSSKNRKPRRKKKSDFSAESAGTVRLVGTDPEQIIGQAHHLLDDPQAYAAMAQAINPYGDGKAAMRITNAILNLSF